MGVFVLEVVDRRSGLDDGADLVVGRGLQGAEEFGGHV